MIHYLKADMWRLNRRIPRWILWGIYLIACMVTAGFAVQKKSFNYVDLGNTMKTSLNIIPYAMAMFHLYFVYEDDLQAKTIQVAIGRGLGRGSVILSKWMQMILLSLLDCIGLIAGMSIVGFTKGIALKGNAVIVVEMQVLRTLLIVGMMTAFVMAIIYYIKHIGATQFLFLVLCFEPVTLIFRSMETMNDTMANIRLTRFLPGENIDGLIQTLTIGQFKLWNFVFVLFYFAVAFGVTYMILRKKEFDF